MKKYLISIDSGCGAALYIGYYADTPNKNYRIYYCGSDSGRRYEKIGNAARYVETIAAAWARNGHTNTRRTYGTKNDIPRRGFNA